MASWSEVVDFAEAFSSGSGDNDRPIGFRVMSDLPVIVYDREMGRRRVVPMRWGIRAAEIGALPIRSTRDPKPSIASRRSRSPSRPRSAASFS
jgi:hypothetical protein